MGFGAMPGHPAEMGKNFTSMKTKIITILLAVALNAGAYTFTNFSAATDTNWATNVVPKLNANLSTTAAWLGAHDTNIAILQTNINSLFAGQTNPVLFTTASNLFPVTTFTITANATTFFTNNFGRDISISFTAATLTGVGMTGTNAGVGGAFKNWAVPLTGGFVPLRPNATVSFTNGITAGNATWTPFP